MSCLYILETSPLSVALFANIFSHSEGCLFILFVVSFALQKAFKLDYAPLIYFCFIFITLGGRSKKILAQFLPLFCPCFPLRSFIVSGLTGL